MPSGSRRSRNLGRRFIRTPATVSGQRELIGYLLNSEQNGYACAFLDQRTNLCTIYPTRPLCCRLFSCDGEDRQKLIDLGLIER